MLANSTQSEENTAVKSSGCPFDSALQSRPKVKSLRPLTKQTKSVEQDASGVWHVRGFEEARTILRDSDTKQAGFNAEFLEKLPNVMRLPILYQEGKPHNEQRRLTARFFTPKAVSSDYWQVMEKIADECIAELKAHKQIDVSRVSLQMAVRVAAAVVGLTHSLLPGMAKRLDAFFEHGPVEPNWRQPSTIIQFILNQSRTLNFFLFDVKPAIQAHKRHPKEDVISHLLSLGYRDLEILTECVTYAAAGMVTTREFIAVALWHFLENPDLRAYYLAANDDERQALLEEILRVEPVVGNIYRRATADITLESEGEQITIRKGDLIDLSVFEANTDTSIVGDDSQVVCPARSITAKQVTPPVMSFGDGAHRCPGSYLAIQEADILLHKLLQLENLRIEALPSVKWNQLVTGYEIRNFLIRVD